MLIVTATDVAKLALLPGAGGALCSDWRSGHGGAVRSAARHCHPRHQSGVIRQSSGVHHSKEMEDQNLAYLQKQYADIREQASLGLGAFARHN